MPEKQLAVIRPLVAGLLAEPDPQSQWCVTFEPAGSELFVQVTRTEINLSWPFFEETARAYTATLDTLFPGCALEAVDPGSYATYSLTHRDVETSSRAVDRIFVECLQTGRDYELAGEICEL